MTDNDRAGLLIVDVQNDFCSGGALPVPGGDPVVSAKNQCIDHALAHGMTVYAALALTQMRNKGAEVVATTNSLVGRG